MAATSKQYELLFQLKGALGSNFTNSFNSATKIMKEMQNSTQKVNQTLGDISSYKKQQTAAEKSKQRVNDLQSEHDRLQRELEQTGNATPELNKQLKSNENQLIKAKDAAAREEEKLNELSKTLKETGVNTNALDKETGELEKQYKKLATTQEKVNAINEKQATNSAAISKTKTQLGGLIGTVAAIGAAIYAGPVRGAIKFQESMAKVATIADENKVPITQLKKEIMALSNASGINANDIAEDVYNAISAGQDTADAVNFVSKSTKLAKAGFAESGDALNVLTTILNAYGMEAEKVTDVSDMLIQTQNLGKTTVAELSSSMGKIIPTANANNVALEQISAGYAQLTSKGIATAESTTYMNSMLNELGKTGSATDKTLRKTTGKSFSELMKSGYSLADVLQIVQTDASKGGKNLADMFGSAEAGKAALSIMSDGVESFNGKVDSMINSAGATEEAYATIMETATEQIEKAKTSIANLGKMLADDLLPYVGQIAGKVAEVTIKFSEFAQGNPEVIATIAKVALGLIALKGASLIGKLGFLEIRGGVLAAKKAFTLLKAVGMSKMITNMKGFSSVGKVFSGVGGKILPIIGVVGGLALAINYISKNLEKVRGFIKKAFGDEGLAIFDKVWGVVTGIGKAFKSLISGDLAGARNIFGDLFGDTGTQVFDTIIGVIGQLKSALPVVVNILKQGIAKVVPLIGQAVSALLPLVLQIIQSVLPILAQLLTTLVPMLISIIQMILPAVIQLVTTLLPLIFQIIEAILPVIINLLNTIIPIVMQIIEMILPVIIQLIQTLLPIIMQIIDTVLPVLINLLNTVVPIFANIIQAILPVLIALLQALMPIVQLVAEIFANVLGAALKTVTAIIGNVMQIFQGLIDFITGVFTGDWSKAWEGIKSIFGGIFGSLKEIVKAPINFIISAINTLIKGLNKLKIPDWVPGVGGMGINIPEIPSFAKGTQKTPETFIAGEAGAELITNAKNRKVFTAAQTGQIFNNLTKANDMTQAAGVNSMSVSTGKGTIQLKLTNAPTIVLGNGNNTDTKGLKEQLMQANEEFLMKLRELIKQVLKEQKEQEERVSYA